MLLVNRRCESGFTPFTINYSRLTVIFAVQDEESRILHAGLQTQLF